MFLSYMEILLWHSRPWLWFLRREMKTQPGAAVPHIFRAGRLCHTFHTLSRSYRLCCLYMFSHFPVLVERSTASRAFWTT